ncbi:uncharacterized protein LOC141813779 [Curcuma longa]|uniref:uncharacterized protein LOC141813779 n=1 Tax=Curcuma longa TaxID=136217 RepID=UPI003D9F4A28
MSQVLRITSPPNNSAAGCSSAKRLLPLQPSSSFLPPLYGAVDAICGSPNYRWALLRRQLRCQGRHYCLFSNNRKQEQARKALENALGEKKSAFEKWSQEVEKKQEMSGGGASGRGGWFSGGGGWFGWFGDEHFWDETQQAILTIVGIVSLFFLVAKGNVIFAVIFNSLLFALRGVRNWLAALSSGFPNRNFTLGSNSMPIPNPNTKEMHQTQLSAKERVIKKWATD